MFVPVFFECFVRKYRYDCHCDKPENERWTIERVVTYTEKDGEEKRREERAEIRYVRQEMVEVDKKEEGRREVTKREREMESQTEWEKKRGSERGTVRNRNGSTDINSPLDCCFSFYQWTDSSEI